jgi:polyhydroxyalkanoate synthesis regulator phasin
MSDEKNKVSDKASEIAKNIWLAGVGAYGKAVDEAQGRLERAMEPPKLFRDLVKAGSALEEDARSALEASSAAKSSVEQRISRVRENFHMQRPARIEDIAALQKKVDHLSRKVDKLTKALAAQGVSAKTPAKKTPVKKAPAKKTASRKTPAKSASRKKPAARSKKS